MMFSPLSYSTSRERVAELQGQLERTTMLTDGEASSSVLSSHQNRLTMCLGDGAIQVWLQSIEQARFSIWVLVFSLDYAPVVAGLVQAVERGLDVRVIIDAHQCISKVHYRSELQKSERAKVAWRPREDCITQRAAWQSTCNKSFF